MKQWSYARLPPSHHHTTGHWSRGEKEPEKHRRKNQSVKLRREMPLLVILRGGIRMYSIIAIPSLWTCVALIAAALRFFWRTTTLSTSSSSSPTSVKASSKNDQLEELEEPIVSNPIPPSPNYFKPIFPEEKGAVFENASSFFLFDGEEKIVEEEGEERSCGFAGVVVGKKKEVEGEGVEWWRGDLGWYRFVDLTALNGSVVKLWDDDRGENDYRRSKRYSNRSLPVVIRTRANWELRS